MTLYVYICEEAKLTRSTSLNTTLSNFLLYFCVRTWYSTSMIQLRRERERERKREREREKERKRGKVNESRGRT